MAGALHRSITKNWTVGIIGCTTMILAGWYMPAIITGIVMILWNAILHMLIERIRAEGATKGGDDHRSQRQHHMDRDMKGGSR